MGDDSDWDSGETLAARMQRLRREASARDWAALPADLLLRVFEAACAGGALPTAASLQGVCTAWRAVARAAPQLWSRLDLTRLRLKRSGQGLAAAVRRGGLGRVRRLVCGPDTALPGEATLALLAASAGSLVEVGLGAGAVGGLRVEHLEAPLLALPRLRALHLDALSIKPERTAIDRLVRALLAAVTAAEAAAAPASSAGDEQKQQQHPAEGCATSSAAEAGVGVTPSLQDPSSSSSSSADGSPADGPRLRELSVTNCVFLSAGASRALAPAPGPAPAFASLRVLDLSGSGRMTQTLHVEHLQWAAPGLVELRLTGFGGVFGWDANRSVRPGDLAAQPAPGWPRLRVLLLGVLRLATEVQSRQGRSAVDDALLGRLAGASPLLQDLDLVGCNVTDAGLAALPSPPLRTLVATHCAGLASDKGLKRCAALFGATLTQLEARGAGSALTDASLAALGACAALEVLDVSGSSFTTEGLRAFAASPAGQGLRVIGADGCRSLERGTRQAAMQGWPALRRLLLADR